MSKDNNETNEKMNKQDFIVKTNELNSIKKVIGIVSGKGGVGKSIVTSLIASIINKKDSDKNIYYKSSQMFIFSFYFTCVSIISDKNKIKRHSICY